MPQGTAVRFCTCWMTHNLPGIRLTGKRYHAPADNDPPFIEAFSTNPWNPNRPPANLTAAKESDRFCTDLKFTRSGISLRFMIFPYADSSGRQHHNQRKSHHSVRPKYKLSSGIIRTCRIHVRVRTFSHRGLKSRTGRMQLPATHS